MAYTTVSYPSFTSGSTLSAAELNQNNADILNGLSDGTKDIGVNAGTFTGKVDANGAMDVAGTLTASGIATVAGSFAASATVDIAGQTVFNSNMFVYGNVFTSGTITASGPVVSRNGLTVSGVASFHSLVCFTDTVQFQDNATFSANVKIAGSAVVSGAMQFDGGISGPVTFGSTLQCTGNATFSASVYIGGDLHNQGSTNPITLASANVTGFAGATTTRTVLYRKTGNRRDYYFRLQGTSSTSDICGITLAETATAGGGALAMNWQNPVVVRDGNTWTIGKAYIDGNSNALKFYINAAGDGFTADANREVLGQITYEITQ